MKRKDCNTQSPSLADRLPSLGRYSRASYTVQASKQPTAAITDIIKHKHSQKESRFPLPHKMSGPSPHDDKPLKAIQPLVTRAKALQANPWGVRLGYGDNKTRSLTTVC